MEIIAVGIGLYALTRLIGDVVQGESIDPEPQQPTNPVIPLAPTSPAFQIESVYSNGSFTLYRLSQLEGGSYQDPESGLTIDETAYAKVGFIVGDPLATGFISEPSGGYTFDIGGVEYTNVRIFTESSGKQYIDDKAEPDEDPLSPEVQPDDETPSTPMPPTFNPPSLGSNMNGYRRGGVL